MSGGAAACGGPDLTLSVNGERRRIAAGSTAADLVAELGFAARPVAVEVNEQVVPRARLADCILQEDDRLEIVTLVGGG